MIAKVLTKVEVAIESDNLNYLISKRGSENRNSE